MSVTSVGLSAVILKSSHYLVNGGGHRALMTDSDMDALSARQRLGRLLFRIGLCLLAIAVVLGAATMAASALSLTPSMTSDLGTFTGAALIAGFLLLIVGVIAWKMPRGIEGDQLWVMKTGPLIRD